MPQQKLQQLYDSLLGAPATAPATASAYNYVNDVNPAEVDIRKMEQLQGMQDNQPY